MRVRSGDAGRGTYTAVAPPVALLLDTVVLPDGSPLPAGTSTEVSCSARIVADADLTDAWRDATVNVSIRAEGFRQLDFEWRPRDGAPPRRVLSPL